MSWVENNKQSETCASEAENLMRQAKSLYRIAAEWEEKALLECDKTKVTTFGITAVSAIALYYKAEAWDRVVGFADYCLAFDILPEFAREEIHEIRNKIDLTKLDD